VAVLHPNLTIVTPTFLEQSLSSIQHVIEAEANGVAQKGIYLNQVRKLQIKLAKLEKQIEYTKFVQQVDKLKFEDEFLHYKDRYIRVKRNQMIIDKEVTL